MARGSLGGGRGDHRPLDWLSSSALEGGSARGLGEDKGIPARAMVGWGAPHTSTWALNSRLFVGSN